MDWLIYGDRLVAVPVYLEVNQYAHAELMEMLLDSTELTDRD
jgi:hypothetical protein